MKNIYLLLSLLVCFLSSAFAGDVINVQGKNYPVDTVAHYKVGPGSYYTALHLLDASKPLHVFLLEVDASNPYVRFKSVIGVDSTLTCETPSNMAKRKSRAGMTYFAGTNADFFVTQGQVGYPIHGCMADGEIARTPKGSDCLIGFDAKNVPYIGNLTYEGLVSINGESKIIKSVNGSRGDNELILFNNLNGHYTHTNVHGTEVLIELLPNNQWTTNKELSFKVLKQESGKGNMKMGASQAILSGHGTMADFLKKLQVGSEGKLTIAATATGLNQQLEFDALVGGDRSILKNGIVDNNDWAELHPRTAIGHSADKSKTYFCVVDGRGVSAGCTTKQLADIIKSAGATEAINLDGGGSSCLYIKEYGQVNHGSDGRERAVSNGIFAATIAPEDNTITEIKAMRSRLEMPRYGVVSMPTILGYNRYETLIDTNVKGFTLSCSPEMGIINKEGEFVASGEKGGMLKVTYKGIITNIQIELKTEAEIFVRLDSVIVDNRTKYEIEVQSKIGENLMPVLSSALTWTVDNPAICKVEGGILTGLSNGETIITGTLGSFSDKLKVMVEIPSAATIAADDFSAADSWIIGLPSSWTNITKTSVSPSSFRLGYTYKSARGPSIRFSKPLRLYGLPDAVKLVFNPHAIPMTKVIVAIRPADESNSTPVEYTSVKANEENTILIPKSQLSTHPNDLISYPYSLDYIKFMLNGGTSVADTN
ncbi:MAG: phosphodiester glycosidase family protein, partial [Bacteroides sp.]